MQEGSGWKGGFRLSLGLFALSFAYAFVRYHVIRDVALTNLPLYTTNKAIALASVFIIGLSFLLGPLARFAPGVFARYLGLRKSLGIFGFGMAAFHSLLSLILLSPAYYGKFFTASGKLNLIGETSLLFGGLAFLLFSAIAISSLPSVAAALSPQSWQRIQRIGYLAYFFVLLHVLVMGFKGWFDPNSYQYGFISISLVAALFILLVLVMRALAIPFSPKK